MHRLKELRIQQHLNQEGLAQKLNISQSTVSAYEIGERTPDLATLIAIANFFHVSLDYLTGQSNIIQTTQLSDLTPEELEHLYLYRKLSEFEKEKVKAYIDGLLTRL